MLLNNIETFRELFLDSLKTNDTEDQKAKLTRYVNVSYNAQYGLIPIVEAVSCLTEVYENKWNDISLRLCAAELVCSSVNDPAVVVEAADWKSKEAISISNNVKNAQHFINRQMKLRNPISDGPEYIIFIDGETDDHVKMIQDELLSAQENPDSNINRIDDLQIVRALDCTRVFLVLNKLGEELVILVDNGKTSIEPRASVPGGVLSDTLKATAAELIGEDGKLIQQLQDLGFPKEAVLSQGIKPTTEKPLIAPVAIY